MYVVGFDSDSIYQYSLSTPWDITTASFVSEFYVGVLSIYPRGIFFHSNGIKMYIVDDHARKIFQYSLSIVYQITVPEQSSAITSVIIPQRTRLQTLQYRTYLSDQDVIKSRYQAVNKKGRAMRVKLEGIEDTYVNDFKVDLWAGE